MGRALTFALFLLVAQALAIPTSLKTSVPPFHRYTIVREMDYQRISCARTTDPEPISTPNPVLESMDEPVVVNFIIGWNGEVYEPLMLSGENERDNREVLRIVKTWRFRPATCNEVPVDTAGSAGLGTF